MTEEEKKNEEIITTNEEAFIALNKKLTTKICPSCGKEKTFIVMFTSEERNNPVETLNIIRSSKNKIDIFGGFPLSSMFYVTCNNCGYTMLFNMAFLMKDAE